MRSRCLRGLALVAGLGACGDGSGPSAGTAKWAQLDAGAAATCGVTVDHRGYCWGAGWVTGRGGDPTEAVSAPRELPGHRRWEMVEVGREMACGLTDANETYCWVAGLHTGFSSVPTRLDGDPGFSQITVGDDHGCGLTSGGGLYCWGENVRGQRGLACPLCMQAAPGTALPVSGAQLFVEVRAGPESTCALTPSGEVWCWGGSEVQGDGVTPRVVQAGYAFTDIGYGGNIGGRGEVCAATGAQALYCFGYEPHENLAQPAPALVALPGAGQTTAGVVGGLFGPFLQLPYAYDVHACAIDQAGVAECWGSNTYGQLGDRTTTDRATPAAVQGVTDVARLAAGGLHTCAVTTAGTAWCWGGNTRGQLGTGTVALAAPTPKRVRDP